MEGHGDDSKLEAKSFINFINVKPVLKTQFRVYHSLNTSFVKNRDDARLFVSETINTLDEYSFDDIKVYNALLETRFDTPKVKSTGINFHIANLIKFKTSNSDDVKTYVDSLNFMTEHVSTIKEEQNYLKEVNSITANSTLKFLQPKHVLKIAIKKFNDEYSSKMNENDRIVFNILRVGDTDKIKELFENQNNELVKLSSEMSNVDAELKTNINKSLDILQNECTTINILNAYELIEEIRTLNGVDNG